MNNEYSITLHIGDYTPILVEFEYTPYEPSIISGPMMCPESGPSIEINSVSIKGGDDIQGNLNEITMDLIETSCFQHIDELKQESEVDYDYENTN